MKLKEVGEFALIEKLQKYFFKKDQKVFLGIGDDCAAISSSGKKYLLLTGDMLIEDVHFSLKYASPYQIGWKALAVNISDIASCGGTANYALISIGLKKDLSLKFVEDIMCGIKKLANKYKILVVGGDTVLSEKLVINITLAGEVDKKYLTQRKGAKVGDIICVSGYLGLSRAGLSILRSKKYLIDEFRTLIDAHLMPCPPLSLAQVLSKTKKISAMMDISDGLAGDLIKLAKVNKVGFRIFKEKIPLSSLLKKFAKKIKKEPFDFALRGGEDYELLFTVSPFNIKEIKNVSSLITEIGKITKDNYILESEGKEMKLADMGYDHFLST